VVDPLRLRQCVLNLLSNAAKFTTEGRISVVVSRRDRRIEIEVADSGIGIAPEALARLFQPFVQAEASTAREFGGTGLGLSLSKRLAEMMGGGITATSEIGVGSVFRMWVADGDPGKAAATA
jgi:signal transduction histidine kinase